MTAPLSRLSRRQFLRASAVASVGLIAAGASPAHAESSILYSPILMYHHVGYLPPNPDAIRTDLTVSPELFGAHLDWLMVEGFNAISMAQLWDGLSNGTALPPRPVVLTFDDGYDDAHQYAFPILAAHAMIGMFFLISGLVEQPGYLTWSQVVEMRSAGMEIGNHTVHHADLWWYSYSGMIAEIDGAAAAISSVLGERPRFFCYPFGHYNWYAMQAVKATGHLAATTITDGTLHSVDSAYRWHRVRIHSTTRPEDLYWLLNRQV